METGLATLRRVALWTVPLHDSRGLGLAEDSRPGELGFPLGDSHAALSATAAS